MDALDHEWFSGELDKLKSDLYDARLQVAYWTERCEQLQRSNDKLEKLVAKFRKQFDEK